MKVAVIGTGIAGNTAAWHLARQHDITVFEADSRIGGHTHTVDVELDDRHYAIDTGFIVFNDWTYPRFIELLEQLGVGWQSSDMGFSVRHQRTGLEYSGSTLNSLFAQRRNLFKPGFYRMVGDILRFNREARSLLSPGVAACSLGEYLAKEQYSAEFRDHFILPMGAAIWSATIREIEAMPAAFFVRFFENHGMLSVNERPVWRVIQGGSRNYVERLVAGHRDRIRLNSPVEMIRRQADQVLVKARGAEAEHFDAVFVACHSDQALALLADPSAAESEVLGAIPYQYNEAVLHTDASLMPRSRRAWAAWNYHILEQPEWPVAVTYNMNILQGLDSQHQFCVTLNNTAAIDPESIIRVVSYAHPVFTQAAIAAQARQREINGVRNTFYCGAWWRNGFHEDGVVSALAALDHFNEEYGHAKRDLRRTG